MTWAEKEIQALQAIGVNYLDAQRTVNWILSKVPPGQDPATWVPALSDLKTDVSQSDAVDASAAWFERAPEKFKRLLTPTVEKA